MCLHAFSHTFCPLKVMTFAEQPGSTCNWPWTSSCLACLIRGEHVWNSVRSASASSLGKYLVHSLSQHKLADSWWMLLLLRICDFLVGLFRGVVRVVTYALFPSFFRLSCNVFCARNLRVLARRWCARV
jgi:hypothetical protein